MDMSLTKLEEVVMDEKALKVHHGESTGITWEVGLAFYNWKLNWTE